jgi:hypothetical protein
MDGRSHVDAVGGDTSRNENRGFPAAEIAHRGLTLNLVSLAVHGSARHALSLSLKRKSSISSTARLELANMMVRVGGSDLAKSTSASLFRRGPCAKPVDGQIEIRNRDRVGEPPCVGCPVEVDEAGLEHALEVAGSIIPTVSTKRRGVVRNDLLTRPCESILSDLAGF